MKNARGRTTQSMLSALLLLTIFNGCATAPRQKGSGDHAYTVYWPPSAGGVRLAIKDLIDMKGAVTTAGSEYLAKHSAPASRDAECLNIARERKVQIVGKTNLSEFALGVSGSNRYFGTPKNPVSAKRHLIPGGSSSGSAVAVANGSADISFGTDTAGSIRVPAACCGVWGLKTTFGLVSLDGVYPIAPNHLDTVGPMAKDLAHLAQGMDLLQRGFSSKYRDATAAHPNAKGIKIGRLYVDGTDSKIDQAIDEALAAKGFKVVSLNRGFKAAWEQAEKDGATVAAANAWMSGAKFQGQPGISSKTKAVLVLGQFEYRVNYRAALKRRAQWQRILDRTFQTVDLIALPTLKSLPPKVRLFGGTSAFEALVLSKQNTVAVNFAGNPALAMPIPVSDKAIPVTSLQLIGPRFSEAELLNAARLIELVR